MKKTISENQYIYAAARIHALDAELLGRDRLERLLEAPDMPTIERLLSEYGYRGERDENGTLNMESVFEASKVRTFELVDKLAPEPDVFNVFRYPRDCHNIKTAIKCRYRHEFTPEELFEPCGTCDKATLAALFRELNTDGLPKNMAAAVTVAVDEYEKSGNPAVIDIILDRACFLDIAECAAEYSDPVILKATAIKADTVNITMAARVCRMKKPFSYFQSVFVAGGTVSPELFAPMFETSEFILPQLLSKTDYSSIVIPADGSLIQLENNVSEYYAARMRTFRSDSFGSGALVGFIAVKDTEEINIRIIIAGKSAKLPDAKIRERMRLI